MRATEDQEDSGAAVPALQSGRRAGGRRARPHGRRHNLRRHRRRDRGGGRRGHQGARRREGRGRAVRLGLDHRQGRFNWLLVNLATAFLASSVLGLFEGQLQKMVALAVLAPIVASQGGNATTQTMTMAVRALRRGDLPPQCRARDHARTDGRPDQRARLRGHHRRRGQRWFKVPGLGVVIGLAMICNLVAARAGGILIPLALLRLGRDPAVASSPFVTTVTDVVGFFSFLGDRDACGSG